MLEWFWKSRKRKKVCFSFRFISFFFAQHNFFQKVEFSSDKFIFSFHISSFRNWFCFYFNFFLGNCRRFGIKIQKSIDLTLNLPWIWIRACLFCMLYSTFFYQQCSEAGFNGYFIVHDKNTMNENRHPNLTQVTTPLFSIEEEKTRFFMNKTRNAPVYVCDRFLYKEENQFVNMGHPNLDNGKTRHPWSIIIRFYRYRSIKVCNSTLCIYFIPSRSSIWSIFLVPKEENWMISSRLHR